MSGPRRKAVSGADLAAQLVSAETETVQRNRERRLIGQLEASNEALDTAHGEIADLHKALGIMRDVRAAGTKVVVPRREKTSGLREGCAVIMCSDWHTGEDVDPAMVFGKNEYNPEIFKTRAARLGAGAEWLIDLNAKAFNVRDAIVWLGGDMMTGHIHEDLAITNHIGPVDEILHWMDACEINIRRIARRVERVRVVCSYGNHGRMTAKPRIHSGAMLSYEVLGYRMLATRLADLPNVEVIVATGEHQYVDVFGWVIRFTHGDSVRYQGGVGGVTIPLKKAVHRWDTAMRAHYTCVGHFHQYLDMGSIVVNGSLIGYSPFAVRIAAEFEEPAQAFFLIDSARGKCQSTPIWVAERQGGTNILSPVLKGKANGR